MGVMIDHWQIINDDGYHNGTCVIILPGRGQAGIPLAVEYLRKSGLDDTLFIAVTPKNYEWYPMPKGRANQQDALSGLADATEEVNQLMLAAERKCHVHSERMILIGHSAGGVVAIETAARLNRPLGGVVVHNGAILDTTNFPYAKNIEMPVVWIHRKDDPVFRWEERYLPSKECLKEKGYKLIARERDTGGHTMKTKDIIDAGAVFRKLFYSARGTPILADG